MAKPIGACAKHAGRRAEARKARALVAYAIDLLPLEHSQWIDPKLVHVPDTHEIAQVGEKCAYWGTCNITGEDVPDIQAEMMALAVCGQTTNSPIEHIVISWKEDEHPDPQQIEEAVATILKLLGALDLQAVWAVHQNTENRHVHIVLNRVRPQNYSAAELGDGWSIDALQQAIALIEARQGWAAEADGLYVATTAGEVRDRNTGKLVRDDVGRQLRRAGDRAEEVKKRREAMPVAAIAAEIIAASVSWPDIHRRLADKGYGYRAKGPKGAVLFPLAGGKDIKLSAAVAGASHAAMLATFGNFVAGTSHQAQSDLAFADYKRRLREANAAVREHRKATWDLLERSRNHILKGALKDIGNEVVTILTLAIADEIARIRLHLRRQYDALLRKLALARFKNSAEWVARGRPAVPDAQLPVVVAGLSEGIPNAPAGYVRENVGLFDTYTRPERVSPAITDFHALVVIAGNNDDLAAGLRMACDRWGRIEAVTDTGTCNQVHDIARAHGLEVLVHAIGPGPLDSQERGSLSGPITRPTPDSGIGQEPSEGEATKDIDRDSIPQRARGPQHPAGHFTAQAEIDLRSARQQPRLPHAPGMQVEDRWSSTEPLLLYGPELLVDGERASDHRKQRPRVEPGSPPGSAQKSSPASKPQSMAPSAPSITLSAATPGPQEKLDRATTSPPAIGARGPDANRHDQAALDHAFLAELARRQGRER